MKTLFNKKRSLRLSAIFVVFVAMVLVGYVIYQRVAFPALPPSPLKIVPIQQFTTEKGLKVYFVRRPELPILDFIFTVDAGSLRDGEQGGLANITANLLDAGTEQLTESQLNERIDSIGALFSTSVSRDAATISMRTLSSSTEQNLAVDLLTAILKQPAFPENAVNRIKQQVIVGLNHDEASPAVQARNRFYANLYRQHPYAQPVAGTALSVSKLKRDDILSFYRRYFVTKNMALTIVGDIDDKDVQALAAKFSNALQVGTKAPTLKQAEPLKQKRRKHFIFPSAQTHIWQGEVGINRLSPDFYSLFVGNHILGGNPLVSILFDTVREEAGLAYDVHSYFLPLKMSGPFVMGAQTRADKADKALTLINSTLETFLKKGPEPDALWTAKQNIIGGFPLSIASNSKIAARVAMMSIYDLPLDYLDTFVGKIKKVSRSDIMTAFKKHVHPEKMLTVTVGPNKKV